MPDPSPQARRVVMFHVGRSGSTVVADLLAQHPAVRWDGELYEVRNGLWDGVADPDRLLDSRVALADRPVHGFEFKFFHARLIGRSLEQAVAGFRARGFADAIVLRRRNTLRKIVSSLAAQRSGTWFVGTGQAPPAPRLELPLDDVTVDAQRGPLLGFLDGYERSFAELDGLLDPARTLRLTYEEHVEADPRVAYVLACDFLGLRRRPVAVRLGRTNPRPLAEILVNHEEVRAHLAGTPHAWMIDG